MSWETLLEAAKFVELQEEQERLRARAREETPPSHEEFPSSICASEPLPLPLLNGRLAAAATQLAPLQPSPPPQSQPPPPQGQVLAPHHQQPSPQPAAPAPAPAPLPAPPPGAVYHHAAPDSPGLQDDDLLGHESKRRTGSGTREVHNKLEKNRRAHLKECFEMLKRQLPICQEEKKTSNLAILHSAIRHIQTLRRKEREFEHEMERLAREKISFQQRLATLKKDLAAQWDHIDINALYPDCADSVGEARLHSMAVGAGPGAAGAPSPASTSTASAELDGGMIIDEDDDDDDDTMSFQSGRQRTVSDSSGARSSTGSGGAYYSPVPAPVPLPAGPPSLRDIHGYRGESPLPPPLSPRPTSDMKRTESPVTSARAGLHPGTFTPNGTHNGVGLNPREGSPHGGRQSALAPQSAGSPIINGSIHHQAQSGGAGSNHLLDTGVSVYKLATAVDRVASAPASGYSAKLLNYSIKVATPASVPPPSTTSSSNSPTPPTVPVPSAPVGSLTTKSTSSVAPTPYRGRAPSPTRSPPTSAIVPPSTAASGTSLMQPLAMSIASRHIQLPVSQVVNSGRWVGVGPTILQLATSPNQRLVLESAGLTPHTATATTNGATPLVTQQRIRELSGAMSSAGPDIDSTSVVSTATAAITMPTINKMMVGTPGVTIVSDPGFHKSSTSEGVRPNSDVGLLCSSSKGLQISSENSRPLLTTTVHSGSHVAQVVSTHPSLSPLVTPVSMVSQGSPVTHILAASHQLGKMTPLISPQYLGAVIKPTMVVVSSPSTLPPNSSI